MKFYEASALYNTRPEAVATGWRPGDELRVPGVPDHLDPVVLVNSEDPFGSCETLFLCMIHNDAAPMFTLVAKTERSMSVGDVCEVKDPDDKLVVRFARTFDGWIEIESEEAAGLAENLPKATPGT